MMRFIAVFSTTALFLLLGFGPTAKAGQDKPEDKPTKQEEPAKPEKQQQEAKAPKQEPQAKPEKQQQAKAPKQAPQAKPEKQQQQAKGQQEQQQQQQEQAKSAKQQTSHAKQVKAVQSEQKQTTSSNGPQRTQEETATQHAQPALRLSARGSGRIPDDRFHSNFGRGHEFRMGNPVMVGGYSRFQYGGYWFGYLQPWPAQWFYTDQFYIDYVDGGYYLYNPYYPGSRFAITVVI
jgi:glucan-binding YG repeat protein